MLRILRLLVPALVLLTGNVSQAMSMREAVELAITNNPAVLASFNAYVASGDGLKAARGGYLPRLDFDAELGSERIENQQSIESSLSAESYRLTLTQMLFDGFATREGVEKERYTQLTRYYEFRQVSEDVALETVQAYLDILRYRHLLAIAKENYLKHLRYHTDIESRVKTGFGRGVDLDQASARLALAESNVLTETTNLHDVSARFLRLVGRVPPALLEDPVIPASRIPDDLQKVLLHTNAKNPSLNAAIETIRSARAEFRGRKAPMMPRFDLRLRKQLDDNVGGIEGNYDEEAIELVMAYNLYNGGSDRARKRQAKYLMFEAEDNRDRVCREVRQTVTIAYNDISSTAQLISFLERNEESISRARKAYEKQFDIGQRTLLDLLDSENEYFDARRSLLNARADIRLAQVQTLAGMGELLHAFGLASKNDIDTDELDLSQEEELRARCPADAPMMEPLNLDIKEIVPVPVPVPVPEPEVRPLKTIRLDVKFNHQSASLSDAAAPEIVKAAEFLCDNPNTTGVVEGHTDSTGSYRYNMKLSQDRASSVRDAILAQCEQAMGRLTAVGCGESRNIATNDTEEGRAKNRRVELVLKEMVASDEQPVEQAGSKKKGM
ncbi:MAG: TolC family outer membrane protein [Pseudomonadales bacterium]|nr:TolC family outer membrane protein [Pseudomonadales bacterium]